MSADPYLASGGVADPSSWNRYAYTRGDPVNRYDPSGLADEGPPADWVYCPALGGDWVPASLCSIASGPYPGYPTHGPGGSVNTQGGTVLTPNFIEVKDPSKTGRNQDRIVKAMRWLEGHIDADCAGWLGDVGGAINGLLGNPADEQTVLIGHAAYTASVSAFTGNNSKQTNVPAGFAITVNASGAFFAGEFYDSNQGIRVSLSSGGYKGGTSQAQAMILIHELAHFMGAKGFQPDFGNPSAGAANNDLIKKNCSKTLGDAKNAF